MNEEDSLQWLRVYQSSMSIEQQLFPEEARKVIIEKFLNTNQSKLVPIAVFFHKDKTWKQFKQYLIVAIDPEYTIHQLKMSLQVKMVWRGYLTEKLQNLYLFAGDLQILASGDKKVKMLYDNYKKQDGWLQLNVTSLNSFG